MASNASHVAGAAPAQSSNQTVPASAPTTPKGTPNLWNDDLSRFCEQVDTYKPTVPDEVVENLLIQSGSSINDPRINRLVALATDKFLAEIIYEAKQLSLLRKKNYTGKNKRKVEELTDMFQIEDLSKCNCSHICRIELILSLHSFRSEFANEENIHIRPSRKEIAYRIKSL
jgi:hypothetical protein